MHNLFEGRSPIMFRGGHEKGMYFFFQVLFKVFLNLLFGWNYLSLTEGIFVCKKKYIDLLKDLKYRSNHTLL